MRHTKVAANAGYVVPGFSPALLCSDCTLQRTESNRTVAYDLRLMTYNFAATIPFLRNTENGSRNTKG